MISQIFLISFVLVLIATYLIRSYVSLSKKAVRDIPGERLLASPGDRSKDVGFWGALSIGWKHRSVLWNGTAPYEAALSILQHYSTKTVRIFFIGNWKSSGRAVLCSDLETVKQVLRSNLWLNRGEDDHFFYLASFGKPLGMIFGNGAYWKAARKIFVKGFRDLGYLNVGRLEELYSQEIHIMLNDLRDRVRESRNDHAIFSPSHIMQQATINVVFKMIFSRTPSDQDPLEKRLADMIKHFDDNGSEGLAVIHLFPLFKYFPKLVPGVREAMKSCQAMYDIVSSERERREKTSSKYEDLMDTFLREVEAHEGSEPNYFTFENLQTTIRDLLMAGSDTIHVTIEHLILFMATNRKEQAKVQEEIDRVIGPHEFPTYEHSKRMIYTQAVIEETWRLSTVVPAAIRTNSRDCPLGGMDLKKGTYMVPLYIGIHHSVELWEDPKSFKPSRFLSECGSQIFNTDKTLTFSCGPRACPGELVGRVAVFLFAVALLREFEWELSDSHPQPSFKCHGGVTRTPNEYFVKIRRRPGQGPC